jgi:hypothetical protein
LGIKKAEFNADCKFKVQNPPKNHNSPIIVFPEHFLGPIKLTWIHALKIMVIEVKVKSQDVTDQEYFSSGSAGEDSAKK